MTETALHGRVSEFGRARGRAFLKMAGHRPCFVYAWRHHLSQELRQVHYIGLHHFDSRRAVQIVLLQLAEQNMMNFAIIVYLCMN